MIQPDQPRCMDSDCPQSSKCARYLDRMNIKAIRVNRTMQSKHLSKCFFFMPVPTDPTDNPKPSWD